MSFSDDVAVSAVREIFSTVAPRGRGPMEAHNLYRLWESTGLRRDDLATGIKRLTDCGCLRAEHQAGNCHYYLARQGEGGNCALADACGARSTQLLRHVAARPRGDATAASSRRSTDRTQAPAASEKRKAQQSRLLILLREADPKALEPHLELVPMAQGMVLWELGDRMRHVFFPVDCIVSLVHEMEDGASSEVATVGNEGMLDVAVVMGAESAARRARVESGGYAWRLPAEVIRRSFERSAAVQALLLRYFRAVLMQVAQSAACNRHHTVDQQVCRLLLANVDRLRTRRIGATHEGIAGVLGVRREGVTEALGRLKKAGLIRHARGVVWVDDRNGLVRRACECYGLIRCEFDRLRPVLAAAGGAKAAAGMGSGANLRPAPQMLAGQGRF